MQKSMSVSKAEASGC